MPPAVAYHQLAMTEDTIQFGKTLAVLRGGRGLSMGELAEASGVSKSTISRLEAGHITEPGITTVRRLADALDVSVGTLIEGGS